MKKKKKSNSIKLYMSHNYFFKSYIIKYDKLYIKLNSYNFQSLPTMLINENDRILVLICLYTFTYAYSYL
jgi:predicted Ser/Thr protein kinase